MIRLAAVLVVCATPALALDFTLPATARQTAERNTSPDSYSAPVGVFANGAVPVITVEGDVDRGAWRLDSTGLTPLQVMAPLRGQLADAGYDIALDCAGVACGGFDFRFAIETLPGPNMYVNVRAFHMVTGVRTGDDASQEVVTLLTSTSATSAYVQIIHAGTKSAGGATVKTSAPDPNAIPKGLTTPLIAQLQSTGYAVLSDLEFDTGSTALGAGPFTSLARLAAYLEANPDARVALVGHTDTVGGLQPNIAISRDRARSVRQRMIAEFGIASGRLDAEGMGYLSPVANNLDAQGREQNRRVEVVLLEAGQ